MLKYRPPEKLDASKLPSLILRLAKKENDDLPKDWEFLVTEEFARQFCIETINEHEIHTENSKHESGEPVVVGISLFNLAMAAFPELKIPNIRLVYPEIKFNAPTFHGDRMKVLIKAIPSEEYGDCPAVQITFVVQRSNPKNIKFVPKKDREGNPYDDRFEDDDWIPVGHTVVVLTDASEETPPIEVPPLKDTGNIRNDVRRGINGVLGRYLDEFAVDDVYAGSEKFTFEKSWIKKMQKSLKDEQNLLDKKTERLRVSDGMILAVATGQGVNDFSGLGINPGYKNVDIPLPVFVGDTLETRIKIDRIDKEKGRVKGTFYFVVHRADLEDYERYGGNPNTGVVVGTCEREMFNVPLSAG